MSQLNIAVIGCGLIGRRRAERAAANPRTRLALVVDTNAESARALAGEYGASFTVDWREAVADQSLDVAVIATPNVFLGEIAVAALERGKHVLLEKPMGCNAREAAAIAAAARRARRMLKVGFNHRYHGALTRAHERFERGEIGSFINLRARYGHGGRPGYEREWRGNPELAGGGELTDQGVHIADLIHWFAGMPAEAFAYLQTAVWPISPLEDNAFGLFRYESGAIASLHTSWTQWKNLFCCEVFGTRGSLVVEGLGGSYGTERLVQCVRNPEGGTPSLSEEMFEWPDCSWELEWNDFVGAILDGTLYWGTPEEGLAAMRMLDALYASARESRPVAIATA